MNALNLIQFENSLVFADAPAAGMSVGAIIGIIIGAVILLIFFFSFFPVGLAISAGASGGSCRAFSACRYAYPQSKPASHC